MPSLFPFNLPCLLGDISHLSKAMDGSATVYDIEGIIVEAIE